MNSSTPIISLTIVMIIGVFAVIGAAKGINIAEHWDENRCDPYVVPVAGFYKPATDPRTAAQFAKDNLSFCEKQYVQNAIAVAATIPKDIAAAQAGTVGLVGDAVSVVADVYFDLWTFCFQTYRSFMDSMKGVARLFQNFMINLYSIVNKLQGAVLSIVFGLISLFTSMINVLHVLIIVVAIVIGIILLMMILLFYVLVPSYPLFILVMSLLTVALVTIGTEGFSSSGSCFVGETPVAMADGTQKRIDEVRLGDALLGGGHVTATHTFWSSDALYSLDGVQVTGDHLVSVADGVRIPVSEHPAAIQQKETWRSWCMGGTVVTCLTTSNRRIPCMGSNGPIQFADWEEIDDDDEAALTAWYTSVWRQLNGSSSSSSVPPPSPQFLDAEAGLSPDCRVITPDGSRLLRDIAIGDRVYDSPTTMTTVVGKVRLAGDQEMDAVLLEGNQLVSCGTWTFSDNGLWQPAAGSAVDVHVIEWQHLYTKSGSFMLQGGQRVRDASDVGLSNLRHLVETIVLTPLIETEHTS